MSHRQDLPQMTPDDMGDIDLFSIALKVWRGRLLVVGVTCVFALAAVLYLHFTTYKFTASLQVTPSESSASSSGSKLGGLSGLASLAGLALPSSGATSPFQLYLESLTSREVANTLSHDQDIMITLFRPEWNATLGKWQRVRSPLQPLRDLVKMLLGVPDFPWEAPDGARLHEYLQTAVRIEQDPKKAVVTISMDHPDPAFARKLLWRLHQVADGRLRQQALTRSQHYIDYLSTKLPTVSLAEHRLAISQTLGEQERMQMMASSNLPFAAEPFGYAVASRRPTSPRPIPTMMVSILAGAFVGALAAIALNARPAPQRMSQEDAE